MATPLVIAVVVLFLNGEPTQVEVLGEAASVTECEHAAKIVIEKDASLLPKDTQAVVKCYDFLNAPLAASGFGPK